MDVQLLLSNLESPDTEIKFQNGKSLKIHKFVLITYFDFFKTYFNGKWVQIPINESAETFGHLLSYIYNPKSINVLSHEVIIDVIKLASVYLMYEPCLMNLCIAGKYFDQYLPLSIENMSKLFISLDFPYAEWWNLLKGNEKLISGIVKFIDSKLSNTLVYNQRYHIRVSKTIKIKYIQYPNVHLSLSNDYLQIYVDHILFIKTEEHVFCIHDDSTYKTDIKQLIPQFERVIIDHNHAWLDLDRLDEQIDECYDQEYDPDEDSDSDRICRIDGTNNTFNCHQLGVVFGLCEMIRSQDYGNTFMMENIDEFYVDTVNGKNTLIMRFSHT